MKRFATALMAVVGLLMATQAFAQFSLPPSTMEASKLAPPFVRPSGSVFLKHVQGTPLSPMAKADSTGYYVNDGTFTYWPVGDTILDQNGAPQTAASGAPYIRLIGWERFTVPGSQPYLDSLHIVFIVDTFITGSTGQPRILFCDQTTGQFGTSGTEYPIPNGAATYSKTVVFSTTKWSSKQVVDTVIHFAKGTTKGVKINMNDTLGSNAGSFFVLFDSYNWENRFTLPADSNNEPVPARDRDTSKDRMGWWAIASDNSAGILNYWDGAYYTDPNTKESVLYPNYLMAVYTHDANAAVDAEGRPVNDLEALMPNPVRGAARFTYSLANTVPVSLTICDALGNTVASVVSGLQNAGEHSVNFDASKLSNGAYFYKLQAGNFTATRTMIVAK